MKFITSAENLKRTVSTASHFISAKTQLPILGNILISASGSKVSFSATNLENAVSLKIPAKVEKEGEITVPGKTFLDIVLNLNNEIEINEDKEKIKISSGSFKSTILGLNATDFPKIPNTSKKEGFVIKKSELNTALLNTLFSLSLDETRPILTGVLFDFIDGDLYFISTDGFRLSKIKVDTKKTPKDFEKPVVPKNILYEILKNESEEDVFISIDEKNGQFIASIEDCLYSSRIIEGSYPDYQKIIPDKHKLRVVLDKEELVKAIKLASVFAREAGNIIKLQVNSHQSKVRIVSENQTTGSQENEIEAKVENDEDVKDFEISYNYKFIEDYLKVVKADEVVMEFSEESKAGKFLDSSSPTFLHLIMPIKNS
jgi:DNA polymerase-3 subunit beta